MLARIISGLLTLFVVYMGFKQGWAMVSTKPQMLDMFGKWHFSNAAIKAFGIITLVSALLILFPQTFTAGNILMAITILVIIGLQLSIRDIKGALVEIPFLLMNLVLIWLQYPLSK
jgi:hypothetical protein